MIKLEFILMYLIIGGYYLLLFDSNNFYNLKPTINKGFI